MFSIKFFKKSINEVVEKIEKKPKPFQTDIYIPLYLTEFNEHEGTPEVLIGFYKSIYKI